MSNYENGIRDSENIGAGNVLGNVNKKASLEITYQLITGKCCLRRIL